MKLNEPLHVSVIVTDGRQLTGVYAVLASSTALAAALAAVNGKMPDVAVEVSANKIYAPVLSGDAIGDAEEASGEVELDSDGHPWSADLHAGTKGKTKEGLWRMKPGVNRPDPAPGYPLADTGNGGTGTKSDGPAPDAGDIAADASAGVDNEEDDEFAEFAAASKNDAAPAARNWTDADLSKLTNQAAQALGGPAKVKETIAEFLPEDATNHSRNIPVDRREAFAKKLEEVAGIEFAG